MGDATRMPHKGDKREIKSFGKNFSHFVYFSTLSGKQTMRFGSMKVVRKLLSFPSPSPQKAKYLLKLDLFQSLSRVLAQIVLERSNEKLLPCGRFMTAVSVSICIALSMHTARASGHREYAKEIARCLALKHQFRAFIYGFSYGNSFDSCVMFYQL